MEDVPMWKGGRGFWALRDIMKVAERVRLERGASKVEEGNIKERIKRTLRRGRRKIWAGSGGQRD